MSDARWMASALALARRAVGGTAPNPAVGAIIVRDGIVLGRGVTAPGGRPHAETQALSQANERFGGSGGATLYVTLEPCAHHGKTPPCADAVVDAGIARVVCPIGDPDPRVAGRGFSRLRDAGVTVDVGLMAHEARKVNAGFLSRIERNRPQILLKLATTLDGRIATRMGESRWITGSAARRQVHLMRAQADAILIGAGTARTDDPMLDVRDIGLAGRAPTRVVVDGSLSLSLSSRLVRTARDVPLLILHRKAVDPERRRAFSDLGVTPIEVQDIDGQPDLQACLNLLAGDFGITRLMCEGGGRLAASLLKAGLVDEIALFQAGKMIGGDGTPSVQGFGLDALGDAPGFRLEAVSLVGPDTLSLWMHSTSEQSKFGPV
ncbi:MAG: bifunctional diaminohydroxyphosphoribosylaminopyrimidine deaminase/5-amino-6-(5-phosphoribosylamino)uracil reductase RibD [Pseudomonadota bacterium]